MRTIVIMVSVGKRNYLTDISFNRASLWASKWGYSVSLFKENVNYLDRSPHFIKLIVHKEFPNFDRYIVIDDDILMSKNAPEIENVPEGFIGLCSDSVQTNTECLLINWTANTGFLVFDKKCFYMLEKAYEQGIYKYNIGDGSGKGIWGPFDQGILNFVVFT